MEKRDLLVAAIAASVAAGCVQCLEYHRNRALSSGLNENDLLDIATLALKIRDKADEFNRGELDALLTSKEKLPNQSEVRSQTNVNGNCCSPK